MAGQGLLAVGVPPQPLWLLYIKVAVLVISLIVLAIAAYALSLWPAGAGGMDIFAAILSFIVYGTTGALELWAPQHFYRIGALIGYILTVIFWLAAWAWSASDASVWLSFYFGSRALGGALGGCAGLGAIAWILVIVHLAFFIRASVVDGPEGSGQAELGQVKAEVPPQQYQQPYPAQPYAQPQQPQQQQPYPPQ